MDLWDVATNFLVSNITGKNYRITGQFSPDNIFYCRHVNKTESSLYVFEFKTHFTKISAYELAETQSF